jgi:hypothetical protein
MKELHKPLLDRDSKYEKLDIVDATQLIAYPILNKNNSTIKLL